MDSTTLPKPTANEFKELLIEFYLKKWDREPPPDLSTDNKLMDLASMVVFDVHELESSEDPMFCSGPDLDTCLAAARRDLQEEQYLKIRLGTYCKDKDLLAEALILLDEDLKREGLTSALNEASPIAAKAAALAEHRMMKSSKYLFKPKSKESKFSVFKIYLHTLVGGHGDNFVVTKLFFNYTTPFIYFLAILRDATQLCVIPPVDLYAKYANRRAYSPEPFSDSPSRRNSQFNVDLSRRGSPAGMSQDSHTARPRSPGARGYTLNDGPWICRIAVRGSGQQGANLELRDDRSYQTMIDKVKTGNKEVSENEHVVILMHSLDRKAEKQWEKQRDTEQWEEEGYRWQLRDVGFAEEDIGEPFMEWMKKDLAKSTQSSREQSSSQGPTRNT